MAKGKTGFLREQLRSLHQKLLSQPQIKEEKNFLFQRLTELKGNLVQKIIFLYIGL